MKFLLGLLLLSFLGWLAVRLLIQRLRHMRGEPVPQQTGPRTITLVSIALIVIYAFLLLWRLYSSD
jgi:predicted tellurium resistance membrane protein TerC